MDIIIICPLRLKAIKDVCVGLRKAGWRCLMSIAESDGFLYFVRAYYQGCLPRRLPQLHAIVPRLRGGEGRS